MPKTTVVIPNYNGIAYLKKCLASLEKQTVEIQVVVIDNGSHDGSSEWLTKQEWITSILLPENTGFCGAVNLGIEKSRTEYVYLLNNDTEIELDCIEQLEQILDSDKKIFSVGAKMLSLHQPELIDDAGDFYCALGWAFARGKGKSAGQYHKCDRIFSACGGAVLYRRDVFAEIGVFDENHFAYLEDTDMGYRARIFGYQNVFAPKAIVYHAGSAVSGSRYNAFKVDLSSRNSVYLIYKNMPLLQIFLNLPFLIIGFGIKILFFYRKGLGTCYVKGLLRGIQMSSSAKGRQHKVPFQWKHMGNYLKIQWELWWNIVRRLQG
ncbi:MAG: glycosyltransferase family 2 protein [Lachnospiraceae bacterium]|nr:glycosyltransferase family 2 protein [Lachnospiraceae bacterium]